MNHHLQIQASFPCIASAGMSLGLTSLPLRRSALFQHSFTLTRISWLALLFLGGSFCLFVNGMASRSSSVSWVWEGGCDSFWQSSLISFWLILYRTPALLWDFYFEKCRQNWSRPDSWPRKQDQKLVYIVFDPFINGENWWLLVVWFYEVPNVSWEFKSSPAGTAAPTCLWRKGARKEHSVVV